MFRERLSAPPPPPAAAAGRRRRRLWGLEARQLLQRLHVPETLNLSRKRATSA